MKLGARFLHASYPVPLKGGLHPSQQKGRLGRRSGRAESNAARSAIGEGRGTAGWGPGGAGGGKLSRKVPAAKRRNTMKTKIKKEENLNAENLPEKLRKLTW